MEEIKLDVQLRNEVGTRKIKKVRREDFIPAIVYGGKKADPTPIKVDRRSYEKIMRHHRGQSVIFHLNVLEGEKKLRDYSAIVREEQHEPVSSRLTHIDFNRISLTEEITVKAPFDFRGDAVGIKAGGTVEHFMWELDITCLPTRIPEKIVVDIAALNIGDALHVKDIKLPEGVRTKHDPESPVVAVVASMKEEAIAPAEGSAVTEPEVLKEKKDKEPAEGEAKAEAKK